MEAALTNKIHLYTLPLNNILAKFFVQNTPESTRCLFMKLFQCWALKDCKIKAEISDEEVALFFDQLIDLVAAAYIVHQANRVSQTGQEGKEHE
jgi:hypothetical protein